MQTENLHYNASGFLNAIPYTADMRQFLEGYKDRFGDAESLTVSLDALLPNQSGENIDKAIQFSEDGKNIRIHFTAGRYYDQKGKVTHTPSPIDIYGSLRFIMERAVEKYAVKFP